MKYLPTSKVKPLTDEELRLCRENFEKTQQVREMTAKAQRLIHEGKFAEAKQVLATKARVFDKMLAYLKAEAERQVTEVMSDAAGLPSDDLQRIDRLFVTLYMAIDIMDSCLMDINDTIHRTNKSLTFEKVDGLHELAQACKRHLGQFRAEQDLYREAYWGDIVDGMYEMMQNKAKAIIRKQKEKRNLKTMEEKK